MDYLLRVQVEGLDHFSRFVMDSLLKHPGRDRREIELRAGADQGNDRAAAGASRMSTRRKPGSRRPGARHRRRRTAAAPLRSGSPRSRGSSPRARRGRAPSARPRRRRCRVVAALGDGAGAPPPRRRRAARWTGARLASLQSSRERATSSEPTMLRRRRTLFRLSTRGRALYRRVASSARARERRWSPGRRRWSDASSTGSLPSYSAP